MWTKWYFVRYWLALRGQVEAGVDRGRLLWSCRGESAGVENNRWWEGSCFEVSCMSFPCRWYSYPLTTPKARGNLSYTFTILLGALLLSVACFRVCSSVRMFSHLATKYIGIMKSRLNAKLFAVKRNVTRIKLVCTRKITGKI